MGAAGIGVELEDGVQRLMPGLGSGGPAHMHGPSIAALHRDVFFAKPMPIVVIWFCRNIDFGLRRYSIGSELVAVRHYE